MFVSVYWQGDMKAPVANATMPVAPVASGNATLPQNGTVAPGPGATQEEGSDKSAAGKVGVSVAAIVVAAGFAML
jgi:hypothetical protein